ncbi:MAG TPA: hypothetical protein PLX50_04900, partial [Candidatus Aminicenantes bacterium]|nr:hypothetical protein [Candidatus Aminicenantes bacterium]
EGTAAIAGKKIFFILLYICFFFAIMTLAFLRGLEKAPTFLVPIINPPFADTARTLYLRIIYGIRYTILYPNPPAGAFVG